MTSWLGPEETTALLLSLRVSLAATLASLPLALLVAQALARWRFPGRGLLNLIVHMPLVLPPVVTGYLLLETFGLRGPVGGFLNDCCGIVVAFRWTGAALASAVMAFPLMVRPIRLSLEAVSRVQEESAADLGARPLLVFLTVTLPLSLPGLVAGSVLGFARAMGEFGATITFVSSIPGETQTLPSAIYAFLQVPGGEPAAIRLVLISVAVSAAAILLSEAAGRRAARRSAGL
ncbi:molybdate ABC transporter permease subunit [Rubellimicrobium roseum]|uniref:Molybdenum transport system permease n=1 Tax=Rubellimicrobium roseum TaxID=687525 RepID=A0A5C4N8Z3_9RHOB|nr:molybdate ABC transporter permease subunit [Rubellimicrobium roseum]TNC70972.1 molybdate ABC transporter permease subunit [Rubellimicrobium roseum]